MADYAGFFLNSPSKVVKLQTLEIYHPNFTKVYRVVRNNPKGLTATLETGETVFFDYYPMEIQSLGAFGDLDQGFSVSFGDLGEILPTEIEAVIAADGFRIKPTVKYREWRSDDLSSPMTGPFMVEIKPISFQELGATFEAKAPSLNINQSGIMYSLTGKFRTLRGFL